MRGILETIIALHGESEKAMSEDAYKRAYDSIHAIFSNQSSHVALTNLRALKQEITILIDLLGIKTTAQDVWYRLEWSNANEDDWYGLTDQNFNTVDAAKVWLTENITLPASCEYRIVQIVTSTSEVERTYSPVAQW